MKIKLILLLVAMSLIFVACKNDDGTPTPGISSFTPTKGLVGTTVTLAGSNFSATASENVVKFNGTTAVATSATTSQIVTTVPVGATSGAITVTVSGKTATSSGSYTVMGPPTITSFAPLYALPGESVTLTGTNFSTVTTENLVEINGAGSTVSSATETSLVVTVPIDATTGKISVTTNGIKVTTANDFEVLIDIPRTGLIGFYPLDGNANDISGNTLNGTLTNGPVGAASRFGTASKALQFDGTDDYVTMGNPAKLQINNTITVAGWIKVTAFNASKNMMALVTKIYFDPTKGGNPTLGYRVSQDFTGGGTAMFYSGCYSTEGLPLSTYTGNELSIGTWYFYTLIIDGKSYKFYQNGTLTNEATIAGTVNMLNDGSKGDLTLGTYGGGFFYNGLLDDITIYNRALSANEVSQLYQQTVTKY